jgi:hypothetical protein
MNGSLAWKILKLAARVWGIGFCIVSVGHVANNYVFGEKAALELTFAHFYNLFISGVFVIIAIVGIVLTMGILLDIILRWLHLKKT